MDREWNETVFLEDGRPVGVTCGVDAGDIEVTVVVIEPLASGLKVGASLNSGDVDAGDYARIERKAGL